MNFEVDKMSPALHLSINPRKATTSNKFTVRSTMDSGSSHSSDGPKPKRLKTLACNVKFSGGSFLLHQFVLQNSDPNDSYSENCVNAVLLSMSDAPADVVNALNDHGYSALHLAVLKNNLVMVKKLLSCLVNVDVNARCRRRAGPTALHLATKLGHLSVILELLREGASIDIMNACGDTALCVAARSGRLDIVKFLVNEGANVNHSGRRGTPLSHAVGSGNLAIVEFLVSSGADVNAKHYNTSPLHEAAYRGSLRMVEYVIAQGADLEARDGRGDTPLHEAALGGNVDVAEFLIGKGADLNAKNRYFRSPLHEAVFCKKLECAAFLLDRGANLQARGRTLLHCAAKGINRLLLDKETCVNARNKDRKTPLDLAREKQNQSCMDA